MATKEVWSEQRWRSTGHGFLLAFFFFSLLFFSFEKDLIWFQSDGVHFLETVDRVIKEAILYYFTSWYAIPQYT